MLYKNQTLLDIELETELAALADATTKEIIVTKPDGTRVVLPAGSTGTVLTYAVPGDSTLFNQPGVYHFQGRFIVDGREGLTEIVDEIVYNQL